MLAAGLVGLATSGRAASTPQFTIVDLGTLGGTSSEAVDINDSGQVVGRSYAADSYHAFSWMQATGMVDRGTLGGSFSDALAVNERGQVVGRAARPAGASPHAFLWTAADGMVDLGTLGGMSSAAGRINDSGQVVGTSGTTSTPVAESHGFLWKRGEGMIDLGAIPGVERYGPLAINNSGQVVGYGFTSNMRLRAFSWTESGGMVDLGAGQALAVNDTGWVVGGGDTAFLWTEAAGRVDLGTLGGPLSAAYAVNDSGQVVGYSMTSANLNHAFFWTKATGMVDLHTSAEPYIHSSARSINAGGQVVGYAYTSDFKNHAFSWTEKGGMVDLGTLGGANSQAQGVNSSGQIIGWSDTATGERHAVLWNPKSVDITPPEISVPKDMAVNATSFAGAVVEFTVIATDDTDPAPDLACTPPSGSVFPIGDTTVVCTATDAAGNTATASFTVTVQGATEQLADLRAAVHGVGPGTSLVDKVAAAQAAYTAGDTPRTCEILNAFINQVEAQPEKIIDSGTASTLIAEAMRIRAVLGC